MSIYTVQECRDQLAKWKAASIAVSESKSYTIGGRSLTRADWSDIEKALNFWGKQLEAAEAAQNGSRGVRMRRIIPHG